VLVVEMQWTVFEPNNRMLRTTLRELLTNFLRRLYQAGAFKGTEDQAFFVRCDEFLNPQYVVDAGQLIVEIGVAPAEPLEYIVLRITRDGDATLRVESIRG
jgi:phage tail sheath protein FI